MSPASPHRNSTAFSGPVNAPNGVAGGRGLAVPRADRRHRGRLGVLDGTAGIIALGAATSTIVLVACVPVVAALVLVTALGRITASSAERALAQP